MPGQYSLSRRMDGSTTVVITTMNVQRVRMLHRKQSLTALKLPQRSGCYLQLRSEHPSRSEKWMGDGGTMDSMEGTMQAEKPGNRAWDVSEDRLRRENRGSPL